MNSLAWPFALESRNRNFRFRLLNFPSQNYRGRPVSLFHLPCWSCRILYIIYEGLTFYRSAGGDWTARRVRETHTHRNLFFYGDYPEGIENFSDRSIYRSLAREMVFEATRVLPLLGEPTPAMVDAFEKHLGWELRDSSRPVVNLWTTFIVSEKGEHHVYSVGGVMLMGVGSSGGGEGEERLEYVSPGRWLGPVIAERLG